MRLTLARQRLTHVTTKTGAWMGVCIILLTGGFIYYATNIINVPDSKKAEDLAEYELSYSKYKKLVQPILIGTRFHLRDLC